MSITERLARVSAGHPWSIVGIWIVGFVVMAAAATQIGDALTTEFALLNNPDSVVGEKLLEERLRGEERALEFIIVQSEGLTVEDVEYQELVAGIVDDVRGLEARWHPRSAISIPMRRRWCPRTAPRHSFKLSLKVRRGKAQTTWGH